MKLIRKSWVWRAGKRFAADPVRRKIVKIACGNKIPVGWMDIPNWGDALNPVLVELLSGRPAHLIKGLYADRHMVIGSILGGATATAEVWGSGFIRDGESVIERPRAVHAVRGPLSRELLMKKSIACPEIYGDPALLLPRFFNPDVIKNHKIGILPHFSDKGHPWVERHRRDPRVEIIDIESGIGNFVRSVKACDMILSSSLHGLICADAYGIPNVWIKLSDILLGGNFKFRDYRLSIGTAEPIPIDIAKNPPLEDVVAAVESHELRLDLRRLLLACPFLDEELRKEISAAPRGSCGLPESVSRRFRERTSHYHNLL